MNVGKFCRNDNIIVERIKVLAALIYFLNFVCVLVTDFQYIIIQLCGTI